MSILIDIAPIRLRDVFILRTQYASDFPGNKIYFELFERISRLPYDENLGTNLIHLCAIWWIEKGRFDDMSYLDEVNEESHYFLDISISRCYKGLWKFNLLRGGVVVAYMYWSYKDEIISDAAPFPDISIKILCNGNNRIIS